MLRQKCITVFLSVTSVTFDRFGTILAVQRVVSTSLIEKFPRESSGQHSRSLDLGKDVSDHFSLKYETLIYIHVCIHPASIILQSSLPVFLQQHLILDPSNTTMIKEPLVPILILCVSLVILRLSIHGEILYPNQNYHSGHSLRRLNLCHSGKLPQ